MPTRRALVRGRDIFRVSTITMAMSVPMSAVHKDMHERTKQQNQIRQKFQHVHPVLHNQKVHYTGSDRSNYKRIECQPTSFAPFHGPTPDSR